MFKALKRSYERSLVVRVMVDAAAVTIIMVCTVRLIGIWFSPAADFFAIDSILPLKLFAFWLGNISIDMIKEIVRAKRKRAKLRNAPPSQ